MFEMIGSQMGKHLRTKKKWLAVGVTAGVLAGSIGYYQYYHKQPTTIDHSAHQASGVMAMGDTVMLDAKARQLAGLQTMPVAFKSLSKSIKTTGKIGFNEAGRSYLTSRIEGRVDEVYVNGEGEYISAGQAIAAVYSPTYVSAQQEYLLALDTVRKLRSAGKDVVAINNNLLQSARRKMELLGISVDDINNLEKTHQLNDHMIIRAQFGGTVLERQLLPGAYIMPGEKLFTLSELGTLWLYADVYEKDLASVQVGQSVEVTSDAYPGQSFSGQITLISPVVDDATRTVKVRVALANPGGKLKPNMFVTATIDVPLGETLVVPESSLIDTGERKVVYVAQDEGTFVKRDVVIGQEADGYIQILSGLQPNEIVVTAATFLIDSQTQLGSFGGHSGHGAHGGGAPANGETATPAPSAEAPATESHSSHSGSMEGMEGM
jgi:Cu(I)/Ag(I) efflux system membrane fusion protein